MSPALSGGNDVVEMMSIVIAIALVTRFQYPVRVQKCWSEALQEVQQSCLAKVVERESWWYFTSEIVKGDTILIQAGDKVPADGLLFEGKMKVSEAQH